MREINFQADTGDKQAWMEEALREIERASRDSQYPPFIETLLDDADAAAARATLGLTDTGFSTGDAKLTFKVAADTGWILCNDGSIGNVASNATTRNNADTLPLFTVLYNNIVALVVQDSTGAPVARGASAAADFAANRRLVIPKTLGRSIAVAGSGVSLTARALGTTAGAETETPTIAKTAAHTHPPGAGSMFIHNNNETGITDTAGVYYRGTAAASATGTQGSGSPLNILDPTTYMNVMIKL